MHMHRCVGERETVHVRLRGAVCVRVVGGGCAIPDQHLSPQRGSTHAARQSSPPRWGGSWLLPPSAAPALAAGLSCPTMVSAFSCPAPAPIILPLLEVLPPS